MDLAQQLVRSCARAFYDTKHILVVDALIIHSAYVFSSECSLSRKDDVESFNRLRDDDMAYLMGMHTKELHKLCGRLREDHFLAS